jgi:hypothetical protein
MGFRPDFSLDTFVEVAELDVTEKAAVNLAGYWTLLRVRNNKPVMEEEYLPVAAGAAR